MSGKHPCLVPLCLLCLENTRRPFKCIEKVQELNVSQEYNCIFIAITVQVNYVATRFVLYDVAAKSACARLGLEQVSHARTPRLFHLDQCLTLSI